MFFGLPTSTFLRLHHSQDFQDSYFCSRKLSMIMIIIIVMYLALKQWQIR